MFYLIGKRAVQTVCLLLSPLPGISAQLTIAWDDNSTGELGFKVERSSDSVNFVEVGRVGPDIASFVDTQVVSAATYSYRIAAYDDARTSGYSNITTVSTPPEGRIPTFLVHPVSSQTIVAGNNIVLSAEVVGVPAPSLQWRKNGAAIAGATAATLSLFAVKASDAGTYTLVAANSVGSATSKNALVAVSTLTSSPVVMGPTQSPSAIAPAISSTANQIESAPAIRIQPAAYQIISPGHPVSLSVTVIGSPVPALQWHKDGHAIAGATSTTFGISAVTALDSGSYTLVASNAAGSVVSRASLMVVQTVGTVVSSPEDNKAKTYTVPALEQNLPPSSALMTSSRLVNLSVRSIPGPDERSLLVGFVVKGASKSMLVRAVGPGLRTYTDSTIYSDPALSVFYGNDLVAQNDNWGGLDLMKSTFARLGAFPLPDSSKDSAVLANFAPRNYTAKVTGAGTGLAMAEIYDADPAPDHRAGRLINLSARAHAGPGDGVLIVGFVISGDSALKVLIRGIGPSLVSQGVTHVLSDPQLALYRANALVQRNDNWEGTEELAAAFAEVGAFSLPDPGSRDSAMIVSLAPGAYTAVVSGVKDTGGVALAEVYELP